MESFWPDLYLEGSKRARRGKTEIRVLTLLTLGFLGLIYVQDSDGVMLTFLKEAFFTDLRRIVGLELLRGRAQGQA